MTRSNWRLDVLLGSYAVHALRVAFKRAMRSGRVDL